VTRAPADQPRQLRTDAPTHRRSRLSQACSVVAVLLVVTLGACGSAGVSAGPPTGSDTAPTTTAQAILPGTGRPPVVIGDKNFTEQFILGELYSQALTAQGFTVSLNKNIGSTQVSQLALDDGELDMYPEYIGTFNADVANDAGVFANARTAFASAQSYALAHGLQLLRPTPFSDTDAIAVTAAYGAEHHLRVISDLSTLQSSLTLAAPPQFTTSQTGVPGLESVYGVTPAHFQPLAVGLQYQALDDGTVQAADVSTTDGQLASGQYRVLGDPDHLFGFQNVVPVATQAALLAEGPAFIDTINRVSAKLTTESMRLLNAEVNLYNQTPASAARQFLLEQGLVPR
jgi:osmoprotectant transport system substrate-binding protein